MQEHRTASLHGDARARVETALELLVLELALRYVEERDRFVVVLVVGYEAEEAASAEAAAALALELTTNSLLKGSTRWVVFDRVTGEVTSVEQKEMLGVGGTEKKEAA